MAESLEVSVVIPTRNRWHLLRTTLASALAQEGVEHEVIVVDDGSTDETARGLDEIADSRLRYVRDDVAQGVAAARNRGIAEARGEWVAFLDDDDLWSPRKLAVQLAAARAAQAGFAFASALHFDERGEAHWVELAPDPSELSAQLRNRNVIPAGSSNVIARADILEAVGGFDESFFHLADWDLWLRMSDATEAAACAEILVAYRKHGANMLVTRGQDALSELTRLAEKHAGADSWRPAGVALSRWIGDNHLRAGRRRDAARTYLRGARDYRSRRCALLVPYALLGPLAVRRRRSPEPGAEEAEPAWFRELGMAGHPRPDSAIS